MTNVKRVDLPPEDCPTCGNRNGKHGARWTAYVLIDDAPACGCGNCGHVVYLTKKPVAPVFYVVPALDDTMEILAA